MSASTPYLAPGEGETIFSVSASPIKFGPGALAEVGADAHTLGMQRIALFADPHVLASAPGHTTLASLRDAGLHVVVYEHARCEPNSDSFEAAAAFAREHAVDGFVSLGGGSVIDTAKAARLCAQQGLDFASFLASERELPPAELPLVAVPTTAGTGSEVSGGAVITDDHSGAKLGIASPNLRADHALVDPVLTHSAPPATTAFSGIDAIAQAIAGMIARTRTPIGDAIALEAIRLGGRALLPAYRDGADAAARSEMACASLMAGLTMNISDCSAEHSLGQAIGGIAPAPHGLTIGLVLAETLERERRVVPDQLERVADALGVEDDGSGDGSRAVRAVRELLRELEFPVLASLGIGEADLDELTERAMADFFVNQSPRPWSAPEVRAAFAEALALSER